MNTELAFTHKALDELKNSDKRIKDLEVENQNLRQRLDRISAVEHQANEPHTFSERDEEFILDLLRMLDEIMEIARIER